MYASENVLFSVFVLVFVRFDSPILHTTNSMDTYFCAYIPRTTSGSSIFSRFFCCFYFSTLRLSQVNALRNSISLFVMQPPVRTCVLHSLAAKMYDSNCCTSASGLHIHTCYVPGIGVDHSPFSMEKGPITCVVADETISIYT